MNKSTTEVQALGTKVNRLKDELANDRGGGPAESGWRRLLKRREMQAELEEATHRLTELEECAYIKEIQDKAVSSGLIETPVAKTPEAGQVCPLCFDDIPAVFPPTLCDSTMRGTAYCLRYPCCGATMCMTCSDSRVDFIKRTEQKFKSMVKAIEQGRSGELDPEFVDEIETDMSALQSCPFCRSKVQDTGLTASILQSYAESGKAWARYDLAMGLLHGRRAFVPRKDRWEAAKWFQLAADEDDNVLAMIELGFLWEDGFPEVGVEPSLEKKKEYFRRAASKGHCLAQFLYALELGDEDETFISYLVLSAAQGLLCAQLRLGVLYQIKLGGVNNPTVFKAVHWLKKSATQGDEQSQMMLALVLIEAKAAIFDGECDVVGHSAVPEACFWYNLPPPDEERDFYVVRRPVQLDLDQCGCCGASDQGQRLRLCTKCNGIRYCGRDCQATHWKLGHKRDCLAVEALRKEMAAS